MSGNGLATYFDTENSDNACANAFSVYHREREINMCPEHVPMEIRKPFSKLVPKIKFIGSLL